MKFLFADFETLYSDEYSLKRMTPVQYVLDPRFEANGCAFKWGVDGEPFWVDGGTELYRFFKDLDPSIAMVTHNALFDMCVAHWRFGYVPRLIVDTMGVARAVLGSKLRSVSLDSVSQHLGLGVKDTVLMNVKGMNLPMIKAAGLYDRYVAYAIGDVEKCAGIFDKLVRSGKFPVSELAVMDMVLRCAIQPQFHLDPQVLAEHLHEVQQRKAQLLAQVQFLGVGSKDDLMSNDKFAGALRTLGVDPPTKTSPTTGKETYAFAKTDVDFIALEEHEDEAVQALVAARLGHKSTIAETRAKRFLEISQLQWPAHVTNAGNQPVSLMPVPLRFSGAHTHRLSGDWKLNLQNLNRGGKLRKGLKAPPDHEVMTVDASQIEARMNAYFCGQEDLVEQFANGDDVYSNFASDVFQKPVNKKDNPSERFVGKQGVLGLGYQLWWPKFQSRLKTDSKNQTGTMISLSDEEAMRVVKTYRSKFSKISGTWPILNTTGIAALAGMGSFQFGPCEFLKGEIRLPSGLSLFYENLIQENGEWRFTYGYEVKKLYGGKLLENMIQALARIHTMDAAVRIQKRLAPYGIRLALQAHDELAYIVPRALIEPVKAILLEEMSRPPAWGPGLPLAAEVGVGPTYGDAK